MLRILATSVVIQIVLIAGCGNGSTNWFGQSPSAGSKNNAAVDDALATYHDRMSQDASRRWIASDSAGATRSADGPSSVNRVSANDSHITADTLEVLDQFITVEEVLEPIRGKLTEMSSSMPPRQYYQNAAELVRSRIVEIVALHLIYQRASNELPEHLKPRIDKAVDDMERERINRDFGGRETTYENQLAKDGENREKVREKLRRVVVAESYLREKFVPLVGEPSRSDIETYYRDHKHDFTTEQRRELWMIDIPAAAFLDRTRPAHREQAIADAMQRARNSAEDARRELQSGVPFAQVAKKYSKFKQEEGGNWGFIREPLASRWEKPSKRFFELHPGEISEIIESEDSFFIVQCGKTEGGVTTPLSELQLKIARAIKNQRFDNMKANFLEKELAKANIGEIDPFFRHVLRSAPQPRLAGR